MYDKKTIMKTSVREHSTHEVYHIRVKYSVRFRRRIAEIVVEFRTRPEA